jgi:hypothetical protein
MRWSSGWNVHRAINYLILIASLTEAYHGFRIPRATSVAPSIHPLTRLKTGGGARAQMM